MKAAIFEHPVNQLTEKYFEDFKMKNFMNKSSLCCYGQQAIQFTEDTLSRNL